MKTILCASDFSENAKSALNWAAFLANKLNTPLHIYHCYHIPVMVNDIPFPIGTEIEIENGLEKMIDEEAIRISKDYPTLTLIKKVEPGFATESIQSYANFIDAGLIVVGLSGKSKLGQVLVGSTAVNISLRTKIPILVIPNSNKSTRIVNFALATDCNPSISGLYNKLFFDIIDLFKPSLSLVHIITKDEEKNFNKFVLNQDGMPKISYKEFTMKDESVESGLAHFTEENKIDLITIIHKKHSFFERMLTRSHTSKLAFKLKIPILVLHE